MNRLAVYALILAMFAGCSAKYPLENSRDSDKGSPADTTGNPSGGSGATEGDKPEKEFIPKDVPLHSAFTEDFSDTDSKYFKFKPKTGGDDFRYYSGHPSLSARNTKVLMMRIDPDVPAGSGQGSCVISDDYTFYGTYSSAIRIPDIRKAQPDIGAAVNFMVSDEDPDYGICEVGFEWRPANPEILYVFTASGDRTSPDTIRRAMNLADGSIYETSYKKRNGQTTALTGNQNMPARIDRIEGFDASARFYTYGFDWSKENIVWWIIHPASKEKIVLWDYEGRELFSDNPAARTGIPLMPARYQINFWHSNDRPAPGRPSSTQAPEYPFELEIDRMSYEPADTDPNHKQ